MNVAIIFAREEPVFNRCLFPVLGRPAVVYPVLAALAAQRVDRCYVSTASHRVAELFRAWDQVEVLERDGEFDAVEAEYYRAFELVCERLGRQPEAVALMFGNAPCILGSHLDAALELLDHDGEADSVATATQRHEFNPEFAFRMGRDGRLEPFARSSVMDYDVFLDFRLAVVRGRVLAASAAQRLPSVFAAYGPRIRPLLQEEGITDIDYLWQVPLAERWLRTQGFTESLVPEAAARPRGAASVPSSRPRLGEAKTTFRVFISTVPFGAIDPVPLSLLRGVAGCQVMLNPLDRRLREDELAGLLPDVDVLIAGTEPITAHVMDNAPRLRLISRVGIGLDNVDLAAARARGIRVAYTPEAPAPAVAELAIGQMLNALRGLGLADRKLRSGVWDRVAGTRLANLTVGVIGTGRVGSRVLRHLQGFSPKCILVNDLLPDQSLYDLYHATCCEKERIYREADVITLHVPLTSATRRLICRRELDMMKPAAILINTARGGIVDERELYEALAAKRLRAAAIDVFENEPYGGQLATLDNCCLTCHMGSCSTDCRLAMEVQATEEAVRFMTGDPLRAEVPESEYQNQVQ